MNETRLFRRGDPVYLEGRDQVRFLRYLERPGMAEVIWGRETFPIPALLLRQTPENSAKPVAEGKPTPETGEGASRPPHAETRAYPKVIDLRKIAGPIFPDQENAAWLIIDVNGTVLKNRHGPSGIHIDNCPYLHEEVEALL